MHSIIIFIFIFTLYLFIIIIIIIIIIITIFLFTYLIGNCLNCLDFKMCIQPPYWMMELYNLISHFLFHFLLIIFHFITNFMTFISFFSFPSIFNFILFCFVWGAPSWGSTEERGGIDSMSREREKRAYFSLHLLRGKSCSLS